MWWKWVNGRQGGTYKKMLLAQLWKYFDVYLIKYQAGYEMPEHTDVVPHGHHYRTNIILYGGGKFECKNVIFNLFNRVIFFRPDIEPHTVTCPNDRLVVSIGFVVPNWVYHLRYGA